MTFTPAAGWPVVPFFTVPLSVPPIASPAKRSGTATASAAGPANRSTRFIGLLAAGASAHPSPGRFPPVPAPPRFPAMLEPQIPQIVVNHVAPFHQLIEPRAVRSQI